MQLERTSDRDQSERSDQIRRSEDQRGSFWRLLQIQAQGSVDGSTSVVVGLYRSNEGGAWEQGWEGEARCNADRERWGAHHITAGRGVTVPA
eukprot:SAG25_NODE_275_length_10545_cov_4.715968_14_plen_92_part_00